MKKKLLLNSALLAYFKNSDFPGFKPGFYFHKIYFILYYLILINLKIPDT
jgi:hypothetical protein